MATLMKNILRGAGYVVSVSPARRRRVIGTMFRPASSAKEALRGDMRKIAEDFGKVFSEQTNGKR